MLASIQTIAVSAAVPKCMRILAAALLLPGFLSAWASGATEVAGVVAIRFEQPADGEAHLVIKGLPAEALEALVRAKLTKAQWREVLPVRVQSSGDSSLPAMLGTYSIAEGDVRFVPRFGWSSGVHYQADLIASKLLPFGIRSGEDSRIEFNLPESKPMTQVGVAAVYPSGDVLPENQLRFYLHFSSPMQQGDSYRHIQLLDEKGTAVADPFLELGEELWDQSGTRLTLLIDPGRIKRGLKPREDVGPVFAQGKRYTLEVATSWRDAHGQPLEAAHRKHFSIASADNTQPDIMLWQLNSPVTGSRGALVVSLDEALDHAMLQRVIRVTHNGQSVEGDVRVVAGETEWQFRPHRPWQAGDYSLVASTTLEDSAGNSLGRPFEVDMQRGPSTKAIPETVSREFSVGEP